jgi:UDP-N-acetylglucosamine acyltransferase
MGTRPPGAHETRDKPRLVLAPAAADAPDREERSVHATAIVEEGAELGEGVDVGPYAVIGARVRVGARTRIGAHAVLEGDTTVGSDNLIGPHAVLGSPPQVRECRGEAGSLAVGSGSWIREFATVHAGKPGSATSLGDRCFLMAYSHVAHDCTVGDGVELANGVQLAGHVSVGDCAFLAGLAAVHQFARVGAYAFVGAGSMVSQDVPPFSLVSGDRARVFGPNAVGLRRHGFAPARRAAIAIGLRLLLDAESLAEGLRLLEERVPAGPDRELLAGFARSAKRGLCAPARRRGAGGGAP